MPTVSCCTEGYHAVDDWTCQLVVKTGTPLEGGVDGPSPGG